MAKFPRKNKPQRPRHYRAFRDPEPDRRQWKIVLSQYQTVLRCLARKEAVCAR